MRDDCTLVDEEKEEQHFSKIDSSDKDKSD